MRHFTSLLLTGLLVLLGLVAAAPASAGTTLEAVRAKGFIQCGVNRGLPGFATPDPQGRWTGIDVDLCRAVAAAVLGDASQVKYTPLTASERFTALQSGEIDILSRNTTWTLTRDAALGLHFAGVIYYDGQGFIVRADSGITSARELDGASVCVKTGTTTALNLGDYFRQHGMTYRPVVFDSGDEAVAAYDSGRCDVFTTDASQLYAQRIKLSNPEAHRILPEIISKEPLGPAVRQGDDQWLNIVRWTLAAMLNAEELRITSMNAARERESSTDPAVARLLGASGDMGAKLGISNDWAFDIIRQVGNYGEVFDRNLGAGSPLNIDRGLNRLWSDGGIQYAPPLR